MSSKGYSDAECLDFDFSIVEFDEWMESMRNQQVQRRDSAADKLKDKHHWEPKYPTDTDILDHYYGQVSDGPGLDPVFDAIGEDDMNTFLEEWTESMYSDEE